MHQLYGCDDLLHLVKTDKAPICGPYLHPVPGKEGKQHLHTHRSGWPITIQEMLQDNTSIPRGCGVLLSFSLQCCFCFCLPVFVLYHVQWRENHSILFSPPHDYATLIVACVNAAPTIIINSGLSLSWAAEFAAVAVDNVECNGMLFLYRSFLQLSILFGHHS